MPPSRARVNAGAEGNAVKEFGTVWLADSRFSLREKLSFRGAAVKNRWSPGFSLLRRAKAREKAR